MVMNDIEIKNCCSTVKEEEPSISMVLIGTYTTLSRCLAIVEGIENKLFPPRSVLCSDPKSGASDEPSILNQSIGTNEQSQKLEEILSRIIDRL
ncbi:MAG TPA: hypothetical protein VN456_04705 [Desulfosporosinus sp.]|nr:hypothetical protein [Desulfosporosinus sp.]